MLNKNQINNAVKKIVDFCQPQSVIIFGSYAKENANNDSDLDLIIIKDKDDRPRYKRASEIRKLLRGTIKPAKDIHIYTVEEIENWKNVELSFISRVLKEGQVLYEN